ncbi:MAG: HAD family hydrolase [Treponematales bacterium]
MSKGIRAVAFDLDGTLYPNYRFYLRLAPFVLRELRLLIAFGRARAVLRQENGGGGAAGDFYDRQAAVMARTLRLSPAEIRQKTESLIYRGWEPLFKKVKLYPHVRETIEALRAGGVKTGLLSDFPPERKLENLGLGGLWDAVLCSELLGSLKPAPLPFQEMARALDAAPEAVLYVGNSVRYDIAGAKNAGMMAALVGASPRKRRQALRPAGGRGCADFVFSDYRQLLRFVLP